MTMQKENRQTRPANGVHLAVAAVCLGLAGAGVAVLVAVIFLLGTGTVLWEGGMACAVLFLWGWPVMSPTLALLSGGLTAYILLALPLEERDLLARFGRHYLDYRRRVPMLLPWRAPVPRAVFDEVAV